MEGFFQRQFQALDFISYGESNANADLQEEWHQYWTTFFWF